MKIIVSISIFITTMVVVFNCKKNIELVEIEFREYPASLNRGSQGFNGLVSYCDTMTSFETRMEKVNNDCESFGDCGKVQAGIRKQGKPGFFLDYPDGLNVVIINRTAPMYSWNVFRWYKVSETRWRVNINGIDIDEFDCISPKQAAIGFGMADNGNVKTITWEPAFLFNGVAPKECSVWGAARGGVTARPVNHAEGGDNITTTAVKYNL